MCVFAVVFDDCAESKGVSFEVSHPDFLIDEDLNLVPRRDVVDSGAVIFIHGLNQHADDMAQVDIMGAPPKSPQTLRVRACVCFIRVLWCTYFLCFWQTHDPWGKITLPFGESSPLALTHKHTHACTYACTHTTHVHTHVHVHTQTHTQLSSSLYVNDIFRKQSGLVTEHHTMMLLRKTLLNTLNSFYLFKVKRKQERLLIFFF